MVSLTVIRDRFLRLGWAHTFPASQVSATDRTQAGTVGLTHGIGRDGQPGPFAQQGIQNGPTIPAEVHRKFFGERGARVANHVIQLDGDRHEKEIQTTHTLHFGLSRELTFNQDAMRDTGKKKLSAEVLEMQVL
jgi:hypothetical protein